MADQDIDRSEQATPFKLQKARERGQTARSVDAVACAVFLVAVACLAWQGGETCVALLRLARAALAQAGQPDPAGAALWPLAARLASGAAGVLLPLLLALPLAAVLASVAQSGMVFSFTPLQMDFQRIHPASGFQRVFSRRTLFEIARACIKLVVLAAAGVASLLALLPQFHVLSALAPGAFLHTLLADLAGLGWKMGMALALVAAADLLYTRAEFGRRMRMSRRELKDEYRNREGDPRIRGRLRELRRELLKRSQALRNTRNADVVLTNPTHYAVALRYVHGEMEAPRVVAKGAGQLAAAMRELAARHRIVVVQNPPLTRRLFRAAAIDAYLPGEFHAEVARIIVWVLAIRQQRAGAPGRAAA
jgi:flagellar biosynthetic protein FlhB